MSLNVLYVRDDERGTTNMQACIWNWGPSCSECRMTHIRGTRSRYSWYCRWIFLLIVQYWRFSGIQTSNVNHPVQCVSHQKHDIILWASKGGKAAKICRCAHVTVIIINMTGLVVADVRWIEKGANYKFIRTHGACRMHSADVRKSEPMKF